MAIRLTVCLISFLLGSSLAAQENRSLNSTELYQSGVILIKKGRVDEAIKVFKSVIEKSPYYVMGHYGLGKAYLLKKGHLKESIRELKLAVSLDRKYAKGYFYLGIACMLNTKYVQSIHAFKKAYELDSTMVEALYNLSLVYDAMNKDYESYIYYKRYIEQKKRKKKDTLF